MEKMKMAQINTSDNNIPIPGVSELSSSKDS